jgi:hypothetical protein
VDLPGSQDKGPCGNEAFLLKALLLLLVHQNGEALLSTLKNKPPRKTSSPCGNEQPML